MQKIGFCDRYGLTKAVLNGTKTMTRRVEKGLENLEEGNFCYSKHHNGILLYGEKGSVIETIKTRYKLGEVVAVAQAYKDIEEYNPDSYEDVMLDQGTICESPHPYSHLMRSGGWDNKMFVRPDLMPHQIKITGVRIERLQAISEDNCMEEGVYYDADVDGYKVFNLSLSNKGWGPKFKQTYFQTPREAFAALIDRPGVGRKGLWESNPWVICYSFKLVK